jgi:tetrahydromethanopterin S-methyltransferase subunit A
MFKMTQGSGWPPLRGDYSVMDPHGRVAAVTLASCMKLPCAAIYGPCRTENLGVEKVVANIISNPNIRYLVVCGAESKGHLPGDAIIALHKNGVDESRRIIGAKGAIPFIENLPREALERFRQQVEIVDKRGLEDAGQIEALIEDLRFKGRPYREGPYLLLSQKRSRPKIVAPEGIDVILGSGMALDTRAWLVMAI